jgi:nickel transport protein
MKPLLFTGLIGLAALVAAPSQVHAHAIESSLERLTSLNESLNRSAAAPAPETLRLESQFSGGQPASDAAVRIVPPDGGTPIDLGRTGADGTIVFTLPPQANRQWEVQVDAGPGHRDYLELPAPEATPAGPARVSRSLPYPRLEGWAYLPPLGVLAVAGLAGILRLRRPS